MPRHLFAIVAVAVAVADRLHPLAFWQQGIQSQEENVLGRTWLASAQPSANR